MATDDVERGEDTVTGLLPNPQRLARLSPAALAQLLELVADWEGPMVDAWRGDVAERLEDTDW